MKRLVKLGVTGESALPIRWLIIVSALAPWLATAAIARPTVFEYSGMIVAGDRATDGDVWFETWSPGARFVLEGEPDGSQVLWALLYEAAQATRSITVTYDAGSARLNAETKTLDFPICRVAYAGSEFTAKRECRSTDVSPESQAGEQALALGWAETFGGSPRVARQLLDKAVESSEVGPAFAPVALRARAQSNESIAGMEALTSEASDRAYLAALKDYQMLAAALPEDVELQFSLASTLEQVGDYPAAEAIYDSVLRKWPDETYRVTVRRSANARLTGDFQQSLDLLNSLVGDTDDLGMKFYYHRGWTLTKLGRFDEAIADFSKGIESQPDYAWAYIRRGCAYASVGDLTDAAADLESAARYLAAIPGVVEDSDMRRNLDRAKSTAEILRSQSENGITAARPDVCAGFFESGETARKRSPLLPAL